MFHDISILIGFVLAFVLVNSHQKLTINDLFQILMRSYTGIDELH